MRMGHRSSRWFLAGAAAVGGSCGQGAASDRSSNGAPAQSAPAAATQIGLLLAESNPGFESSLREAAHVHGYELVVFDGVREPSVQDVALRKLFDRHVAAIVMLPSAPDPLYRAMRAASDQKTPLLSALRGDGKSGPWAGVASATLATESGDRVAARLIADGVSEPRIIVIEDPCWPESQRRADLCIDAIEKRVGKVHVKLRLKALRSAEATVPVLLEGLVRMRVADVLVAGDPVSTEAALDGASRSSLAATLYVVGVTDDETRAAAARAGKSRASLVTFHRSDCVRAVVDGVASLIEQPANDVKNAVACELVGLETTPKPAGGS